MNDHSRTERLIGSLLPKTQKTLNPKYLWGLLKSDPRWPVALILLSYLLLGMTILGFNRSPAQIIITTLMAMALEVALTYIFKNKWIFPLSAMITSFGLSILLNYSHSYAVLCLPVFFAIAGKYVFTVSGRHIYNPGLFGIVASLLLTESLITASPAYQWNGIAAMSALIVLPALLLFMPRVRRSAIVLSFLTVFTIQTALRAWIMKHHLPFETLFFGTLSSPSFFLFVFFMLTDPATSPSSTKQQIIAGAAIATLDLIFHIGQSYFTFFYAAFVFATARALYTHYNLWRESRHSSLNYIKERFYKTGYFWRPLTLLPLGYGLIFAVIPDTESLAYNAKANFQLMEHDAAEAGISADLGNLYDEVDPRIQHVIKWIFSVGDSVAIGDYDNDGYEDLFLTLVLKKKDQRTALYRNLGNFKFERIPLPALDDFIAHPKKHGVATNAIFNDYDNDGDRDIFLTVAFGSPRLLQNQLAETGHATFVDVTEKSGLAKLYTNSISATFADFNRDGHLDLFIGNVLPEYLPDYTPKQRLNLFKLPEAEFDGDRRMFNFMHRSWHEADNGGHNILMLSDGSGGFVRQNGKDWGLVDTRWTLAMAATDINLDGWPDLYIANDFGADTVLFNESGRTFKRLEGKIFGSIGRDTYKGMNATSGDIDRNGSPDIYVSNVHHHLQAEGSMLWLTENRKKQFFPEMSDQATFLGTLNERRFGWGAGMVDIDDNGWLDIVQANGMVDDTIDKRFDECPDYWYVNEKIARSPPSYHTYADKWGDIRGMCIYGFERNRIYLNRGKTGTPQFVDVAVPVGAGKKTTSRGVAAVDLDNNGRSDLVFSHMFHPPTIYEHQGQGEILPNWVGFELEGSPNKGCNRDAVGTKIRVEYFDTTGTPVTQHHELQTVSGLLSQGTRRIRVGLGRSDLPVVNISVQWCGYGRWQPVFDVPTDQYHRLSQVRGLTPTPY